MPDPVAHSTGTNYFDETAQIFYVVIKGPSVVQIRFQPVIKMVLKFPLMKNADFSPKSLVDQMSAFLGVSSYSNNLIPKDHIGS